MSASKLGCRPIGVALLKMFLADCLPKISDVRGSERSFEIGVSNLDSPFVGIIDLDANLDGKRTIIDFKTAATRYAEHEAKLSDQLSAYQMAEPDAERTALCVLVKTKVPKIEWHVSERNSDDLMAYVMKAGTVGADIAARRFYKRPGLWCTWCDFLPICTNDERRSRETLTRIAQT